MIRNLPEKEPPMYTIDEFEEILNKVAEEIPPEYYEKLNGGILVLEECKPHPQGLGDLYILGDYNRRYDFGRYICVYYGSFVRNFPYLDRDQLKTKLREVLRHEFTHHVESLAGEKDLEIEDAEQLRRYKESHHVFKRKDR